MPKNGRLKRWFISVAGIAVLVLLVMMVYAGLRIQTLSKLSIPALYDWTLSAEVDMAELTVGVTTFRLPRNFLLGRSSRAGGKVDGFVILVLLPGLEPYSLENAAEFSKPGHHRKLDLLVESSEGVPSLATQLGNSIEGSQFSLAADTTEAVAGLVRYESTVVPEDELYVPETKSNVDVFYRCLKRDTRESPSCHGTTFFRQDIVLHYVFSRIYINDWKTIDAAVKKLLESFVTPHQEH